MAYSSRVTQFSVKGKLQTLVQDVEEALILTTVLVFYFEIDKDQLNEMGLSIFMHLCVR